MYLASNSIVQLLFQPQMAVRALPRAITSCATSFNDSPNSFDIVRTTPAFSATNNTNHGLATAPGAERVPPRRLYALHGLPCIPQGQMSINVQRWRKPSKAAARQILNSQVTLIRQMKRLCNLGPLDVDFGFLPISHKY